MSIMFTSLPSDCNTEYRRDVWSRFFGHFIASAREKAGRSVEETAALAMMSAAQWSGVETGDFLPMTRQQLHVVADAVGMDWETMAETVLLCREAWDLR